MSSKYRLNMNLDDFIWTPDLVVHDAKDFRATCARRGVLDAVDEFVTSIDINAGITIGEGGLLFAHGVLNRLDSGTGGGF